MLDWQPDQTSGFYSPRAIVPASDSGQTRHNQPSGILFFHSLHGLHGITQLRMDKQACQAGMQLLRVRPGQSLNHPQSNQVCISAFKSYLWPGHTISAALCSLHVTMFSFPSAIEPILVQSLASTYVFNIGTLWSTKKVTKEG